MAKKPEIIASIIAIITGVITIIMFSSGQASMPALVSTVSASFSPHANSINNQANVWTIALQNFAPSCEKSGNPTWVIPEKAKSSTNIQCLNNGLQIIPAPTASLAEIDLDQINGRTYSQTRLDLEVQVTFGNNLDSNTLAGLVVQTPQQGFGGYGLALNSTGYWELVDKGHRQASWGQKTSRTISTIEMKVQQGKLYGFINEKQVFVYDDTLNPPLSAVGLIVYGSKPSLSSILFSDFMLKY